MIIFQWSLKIEENFLLVTRYFLLVTRNEWKVTSYE